MTRTLVAISVVAFVGFMLFIAVGATLRLDRGWEFVLAWLLAIAVTAGVAAFVAEMRK